METLWSTVAAILISLPPAVNVHIFGMDPLCLNVLVQTT